MNEFPNPIYSCEKPPHPEMRQTAGIAVASLVAGILGISPVGILLGILALRKINRSRGQLVGRELAWAGIIISLIWVVIWIVGLILLAIFLGGSLVQTTLQGMDIKDPVVATWGQDGEIRISDLRQGQRDLELLKILGANQILQAANLNSHVLARLLFGNSSVNSDLEIQLKQAFGLGYLDSTPKEIHAFWKETDQENVLCWILLTAEAEKSGSRIPEEQARKVLETALKILNPQESNPDTILNAISTRLNVTPDTIVPLFNRLLNILQYADQSAAGEIITADCVKFNAEDLLDEQSMPTDEEIIRQFESYQEIPAGLVSSENPYGFGYLLPKTFELEYCLIKRNDVQEQVPNPSEEELEEYYIQNRNRFQESVQSDPDDPNSGKISRPLPFPDVVNQIKQILIQQKASEINDLMLREILAFTESGLTDCKQIAERLFEKYNIPIDIANTGMIDGNDLLSNEQIRDLFLKESYGSSRTPIDQWVRSARIPKPDAYDHIGVMTDGYSKTAVVHIVRMHPSRALPFHQLDSPEYAHIREQVIHDCKIAEAMEKARTLAKRFAQAVAENGWQNAIDAYNVSSEIPIQSQFISVRRRLLNAPQAPVESSDELSPFERQQERSRLQNRMLADLLRPMIPEEQASVTERPQIICSELGASCYVVRNVSRKTIRIEDYANNDKGRDELLALEMAGINGFGVIHFRPQNIFLRMNYRLIKMEDAESPMESSPVSETISE